MRSRLRGSTLATASLFLIIASLLLAACSIPLPPGIPSTGGATFTPIVINTSTASPATATNAPALVTSTPVVITSTPAVAAATNTPVPPTNTPLPAATATVNTAPTATLPARIPLPTQLQTIQFAQNTSEYVVTTTLQQGVAQGYQLALGADQHMYLTIDGNASITLYDPNKAPFTSTIQVMNPTRFNLTQAGNYAIAMMGSGPAAMSIYVPPAGANWTFFVPVPPDVTPIQFAAGATSASLTANTTQGTPVGYSIAAQAGQRITVTTNGNALAFLTDASKVAINSLNAPVHQFIFPVSKTGTYFLVILANGPAPFTVSIPAASVPATGGTGSSGNPIPMPGTSSRVTFGSGNASATINTTLAAGQPKAYLIAVQAGQTLYVSTTGKVDVTAYGPGSAALVNGHADFPTRWTIPANTTGDYTFVVSGSGAETLTFYAPPK